MDYRVIYVNAQLIFAIMYVTMYCMERISRKHKMSNKLHVLYVLFMITIVLDTIWVLIDGNPNYYTANFILNFIYLSVMAVIGYAWFLFALDIFPSKSKLRKYKYLLAIPMILDLILIIASIKTGWIFYITPDGTYVRGPLHTFSYVKNYAYLLLGSYVAIRARGEAHLTSDKKTLTIAALFPLPILVLTLVQMNIPPGLPAMQGGVMISLLLLYATNQNVLVTRDVLTGLPNRYAFENTLVDRINSYHEGTHNYLLEGDVDGFKEINDTFGHPTGDKALVATSEVLKNVFSPYGSIIFRVGGDEFMMFVESEKPLDTDKLRGDLNSQLAERGKELRIGLSMSLGVAECTREDNFKSIIDKVDEDLYKVKAGTKDN